MNEKDQRRYLRLSDAAQRSLIEGARDSEPVRGLTHGFYKYPARFSPVFVRRSIQIFTKRGELVFDPHVGGGTTVVEALATGREAVGVDISELAEFVTKVKTTILSNDELVNLQSWAMGVASSINMRRSSVWLSKYDELGYYKHLSHRTRWRLRKAIEQGLNSATTLGDPNLENFCRCAVLRTAQWALDGRSKTTSIAEFREFLKSTALSMVEGARALRRSAEANGGAKKINILQRSAAGLHNDERLKGGRPPKLIVTSPPYPGVHVLYHRWQVDGRKETPLPFMIANKLDGSGSSYYTMGDRKFPGLKSYFENIRASMSSVVELADKKTIILQMIAFSEPSWQLQRYLEIMEEIGLKEIFLTNLRGQGDGRLWRTVPGRRWYSDQRGDTPGSHEVVLIHRKVNFTVGPSELTPKLPSEACLAG